MPYRTAFWILILMTVISAVLQMLGYNFLEVLIVLLIIDSLGFGSMIEIERKKSQKEVESSNIVTQKIEGLEKICQDVFQRVSTNPSLAKLEEKMNLHKEERDSMLENWLSIWKMLEAGSKKLRNLKAKKRENRFL
jgi:hypothetical protein